MRIVSGRGDLDSHGFYHRVRALPRFSPSGAYWRIAVTTANLTDVGSPSDETRDHEAAITYSTGGGTEFAGGEVTVATHPGMVADLILNALPEAAPSADDPAYVSWFAELMRLVESAGMPPIAYAYYFDHDEGWEVGWGRGIRHPHPPAPPSRHR